MNALPPHDKFHGRGGRRWAAAIALSVAAHVAVLVPILAARAPSLGLAPPAGPIFVELIAPPPPAPAPSPEPAEEPAPAGPAAPSPPAGPVRLEPPRSPPPPPARLARRPPPANATPVAAITGPPQPTYALVGTGQLAGALRAGGGGTGGGGGAGGSGNGQGGGDCDMIRKLQAAMREDPEVRAAVAQAHGVSGAGSRALLIWNGGWIQNPGQEGKGLAGLRQALSVEVAFAPRACQAEPVKGLVLLTLSDAAASPRVALGKGAWTWGDLVERRR